VDQITQAMITVNLEDKSESFIESYRFTLSNAQGEPVDAWMVEANIAEVSVTLYIKRVKEIKLVVDVVAGGGANEKTSEITIDPAVIKIAGNETALEDIEEINLGTINLGDLLKDTKIPFVINIPPEFENLSGKTTANVEVKFPDLATTSIPVTTFHAMNVPEGFEVEFITQELPVNVRGSKELIKTMTAENITVSVDFSNAVAGNYTLKAIITMGEGYTSVGAMGSYSVSATVKEVEEDEALTK
jgi:YbbR domain-containing protein